MTLEEINDCSGFTVQVTLNGVEATAEIRAAFSPGAPPRLLCPQTPDLTWERELSLTITEDVAAKMSLNGANNIFSTIHLMRDGEIFLYA